MRVAHGSRFVVPETVAEVLALLADAAARPTLLCGGTHVMSRLHHGLNQNGTWVDVSNLPGFAEIHAATSGATLGPAVTYTTLLEDSMHRLPPLLRLIASGITGGTQIRNQGTIGGSACYANPGSDAPTGLVAVHASMHLASESRGTRQVPAAEFFVGPFTTALHPDEMLIGISVEGDMPDDRWGYAKLKTAESSWPVAVAAARLRDRPEGGCELCITVGAATITPVSLQPLVLRSRESLQPDEAAAIRHAVDSLLVSWWADELSNASYRRRVAPSIAVRAVEDALAGRTTRG
jgi:carbon-monoxide dehydrogenase medium subunit